MSNQFTEPVVEEIFSDSELQEDAVLQDFRIAASDRRCRACPQEAVVRDFRITAADRIVDESKRLGERVAKAMSRKGER